MLPYLIKFYHFSRPSIYPSLVITCTGRFIMFSMITNIYNKKTKGPTLMELFTATGKLKQFFFFFFLTTRDVQCVYDE